MFLLPYLLFSLPLLVSSAVKRQASLGDALGTIEKDCQQKNNATREDLIALHDLKHMKDTRAVKCMVACILETYGSADEQDAPEIGHLAKYFGAQFKPADQEIVMKIGMDCFTAAARQNTPDNCDLLFKSVQCFFDKVAEAKIEIVKFYDV